MQRICHTLNLSNNNTNFVKRFPLQKFFITLTYLKLWFLKRNMTSYLFQPRSQNIFHAFYQLSTPIYPTIVRRIKTVASLPARLHCPSVNRFETSGIFMEIHGYSRLNRKLSSGPALLLNLRCEGEARLLERTISQERWVMRVPLRNGISCKGSARSTHDNLVYLVIYIHVHVCV